MICVHAVVARARSGAATPAPSRLGLNANHHIAPEIHTETGVSFESGTVHHMPGHDVPFASQYTDLGHHEWRARGCGIASLKMVMDFWSRTAPSLDKLLETGLELGAHIPGIGWSHSGLVRLAKQYGHEGFSADWAQQGPTPKSIEDAWTALAGELERGPVLASVYSGLDPDRGGGHIVVVTGIVGGLVAFNDPQELAEREGRKLLALESFLRAFKRRYLVIRPK